MDSSEHWLIRDSSFLFFLFLPMLLQGQNSLEEKRLQSYRLPPEAEFNFDGAVDENFWEKIEPATGFRQQEPREGARATERTEVRIAFDDEYLYMGVILYDSNPSGIKAYQNRRDANIISDDRFTWIFDTYNDQRIAYYMEVNPNGLRTDGLLNTGQGSSINFNWDGIWNAKTLIGDFGWSVEIRIPFSTLNFDAESSRWGVNFLREIRRKNETVLWTGYRRSQGINRPQDAGLLTGLSDISQGIGLEVVPFGIAQGNEERITGTDERNSDTSLDAGFDINYSITPSLKASVTYNTDFAEAEVDQRQVNLTRFPIQFPEQRDFFLEGANIYEFAPASNINPYFSRRIGLRGGEPVPITYGGRILGNIGKYNMALLHVRTGGKGSIQPEQFSVARIKRNIGSESTIGVIYTRRSTRESDELTPAIQDRHTFGADLEWGTSAFLGDKNLQFQAFFVYHTAPFADGNGSDFWDRTSRGLRLNYPNQPFEAHVSYREFGDAFDPAVGFAYRNSFRRLQPTIEYSPQFQQSELIQQIDWELRFEHLTDLDFKLLTQEVRFTLFDIRFMSGDIVEFDLFRNFERLREPFDIRRDGSIIVPVDEYVTWGMETGVQTASFRSVSAELSFETKGFWSGTSTEYSGEVTIRPYTGITLSPEYVRTNIQLKEGDFSTDLFRLGANVDLTTSTFLTTKIQYDNLSRQLAMNNRFRWIIRPGSDLYLVYNHNWIENPMQRFRTMQRSGTIKVSYTYRF